MLACKRDPMVRDRDETETFDFQSETRSRPRPSHVFTRPRQRRLETTSRDRLETETSRPRLHPCQTRQRISAVSRPKFTILSGYVEEALLLNKFFFPIVDTCLSCEDIARQSCAMVLRWRFFVSCICSEPRAAHFRPAF